MLSSFSSLLEARLTDRSNRWN